MLTSPLLESSIQSVSRRLTTTEFVELIRLVLDREICARRTLVL